MTMLPKTIPDDAQTNELKRRVHQVMLTAAYRQQLATMKNGIFNSLPIADDEIAKSVDLIDEAALMLTAYIELEADGLDVSDIQAA
ncbi:MAG: hypothetical protein AAF773_04375 [Cyanobacteria bacterium P01_D01_bin.115]